ncbi:hypothetical protein HELRODRAFT_85374 [Helobdella robusta]|uniref:Very-long-chain 3-oxoacyl-CoA synthase n=1 Tax=Helobdella robusta TaxID=6412 RepID=T1G5V9_HELRO|nr:hypothetical protein HELRODRAFT_85374 [Helobdella robusta]ESN97578.1 hypothetical protein HELRODRAFT_85374 [Helobdella robusta]
MKLVRYYFVLVSLMWNGVEAHNMYRMLVVVYNSHVSHFILISNCIAWGCYYIYYQKNYFTL